MWKYSSSNPTDQQMQYDRATEVIAMNAKSSIQRESANTSSTLDKTHRKDFAAVIPVLFFLRRSCGKCYKLNCNLHLISKSHRNTFLWHQVNKLE